MSSRRGRWALITLVMLLAASLRVTGLGAAPPGLSHDEVINGLVARGILQGNHAVYFSEAKTSDTSAVSTGGHEPLVHYVQAATIGLFGENWLGIRWPSFAFGMLTIAAVYALVRLLFNGRIALFSISWLSVSFWPLFYARVGLRAAALPFAAALCAYFFLQTIAERGERNGPGTMFSLLAGAALGLALYTYMAARVLPFILVAYLVYLRILGRISPFPWTRMLHLSLVAALVAAPILLWLATHPSAEGRISEVSTPLNRLLAGDPSLVWRNLIANLGFFTFVGDPWFHQGLPGRPVFADPISAALFWAGVLIALWRWRQPRYGFLLIWLVGALAPSILSSHAPPELISDAPSSIRDILDVVVAFVFPGIGAAEAIRWLNTRDWGSRIISRFVTGRALLALLLVPCLSMTVRDYFVRWTGRQDVRYLYQTDLTAVAQRIDQELPGTPSTVAGLSVHSLDRATLQFAALKDVDDVRLCDTRETLVIPPQAGAEGRLFVPRIVPFDADIRQRLLSWGGVVTDEDRAFASYHLPDSAAIESHLDRIEVEASLPDGSSVGLPASFAGRLSLLGYEWLRRDSGTVAVLTYWRVDDPPAAELRIFGHLLDERGDRVAQHDGLGSPPQGWAPGDLIVQKHVLAYPESLEPGLCTLRLGLYYVSSGSRLSVEDAEWLSVTPIEVTSP